MQYSLNYSGTRFVKLLSFLVDPSLSSWFAIVPLVPINDLLNA